MRCLRLAHATLIETPAGAVLFSYNEIAAVKEGEEYFSIPARAATAATNAHVDSFVPEDLEAWEEGRDELLARARRVLGS
jgi:hypothetical protein